MQVAEAVAKASWVSSLQHLLSQPPITTEDTQLWLCLLPCVITLLHTHTVQPSALHLLALSLRQAALPVLGSKQAATGQPSLPMALTNHADAASVFGEAQAQLTSIDLTQVRY